jgi:hypothetical protein
LIVSRFSINIKAAKAIGFDLPENTAYPRQIEYRLSPPAPRDHTHGQCVFFISSHSKTRRADVDQRALVFRSMLP